MPISGASLLSLLSPSTATPSSVEGSKKIELSPIKARLTALVWEMAEQMRDESGFISKWAVSQIVESRILPKLYQLSDDELRTMMMRARDFMGDLLSE